MTVRFILAGAALVLVAGVSTASLAENDKHKEQQGQSSPQGQPPAHTNTGQPQFHVPQGQMSAPNQTGGGMTGTERHDRKSGFTGQSQMYAPNQNGGGMTGTEHHDRRSGFTGQGQMYAPNQTGGGMTGTEHHDRRSGSGFMGQSQQGGGGMMGRGGNRQNFDRHAFQRNFHAERRFHIGVYERPRGWYRHRWVFGEILPAFFWSQDYWISDYYDYGLDDPPPGYVWVRYGDDALLVEEDSGEILEVDYGLFD